MGILDTLLTGIGAKAMPKANRIAHQAVAVVKGNTSATQEPDPPDHESCDSAYLHTLFYDLEAAANMRTNCPSSRSPVGRTPMEVAVQRGILINRFKEASRATSKNPAQADRSARAALANPHIGYESLTPEVAAALGSTVDMVNAQNQDDPEAAFMMFNRILRDNTFHLDRSSLDIFYFHLSQNLRSYDAGYALAVSSGNDKITPEVALNFAYALGAIGPDKTQTLHRQTGLTFFARYTPELLTEFHANLQPENNSEKSPLFVSFPMADYNGAFYSSGHSLDPLMKHYRLFPSESGDERQVYENIGRAAEIRGPLSGMVLAGHGNEISIRLSMQGVSGSGWNGRYVVDPYKMPNLIDTSDKEHWMGMRSLFIDAPVVALFSCSTGKNPNGIAGMFSEVWPNGKIFAPTEDYNNERPLLTWNGGIRSISYNVPTRKTLGGKTEEISRPSWSW